MEILRATPQEVRPETQALPLQERPLAELRQVSQAQQRARLRQVRPLPDQRPQGLQRARRQQALRQVDRLAVHLEYLLAISAFAKALPTTIQQLINACLVLRPKLGIPRRALVSDVAPVDKIGMAQLA